MANQPNIIPMPWAASNTVSGTIPETTVEAGKASWAQGFPVETGIPLTQGGIPPKYSDFNAILKILSEFAVFAQSGGQYAWSNQLDYSVGSLVLGSDGYVYRCAIANGPSSAVRNPVGDTTGRWEKIISQSDIESLQAQVDGATSAATIAQSAATDAQTAVTALDGAVVKTTGNQSVAGTKTYTGSAVFSGGATFVSGLTTSGGITLKIGSGTTGIPATAASNTSRFLRGDGSWADIVSVSSAAYATSAGVATKVGASTVGTATKPVYISAGVPVSMAVVASATSAASAGVAATAVTATSAASAGVAASAGIAAQLGSSTVGTSSKPVYISAGIPVSMTVVNSATNATNAATATSATNATSAASAASAGVATKIGTSTVGTATKPVYISGGIPVSMAVVASASSAGNANTAVNATSLGGYAASDYVTVSGTQTISGAKTFASAVTVTSGAVQTTAGNLFANRSDGVAAACNLSTTGGTTSRYARLEARPDGMIYLKDVTNNKNVISVNSAGTASFFGNANTATSANSAENCYSMGNLAASEYVNRGGNQTISGTKAFQNGITVSGGIALATSAGSTGIPATNSANWKKYLRGDGQWADVNGYANVKDYGAVGDGTTDDTDAIQAAIATQKDVYLPAGVYVVTDELTFVKRGQRMFGDGRGYGRPHAGWHPVKPEFDWVDRTTILLKDPRYHGQTVASAVYYGTVPSTTITNTKLDVSYVKTRYKYDYSESPAEPLDLPMSVGINVQAENVTISDLCVRLYVDPQYKNVDWDGTDELREATMGADWDVGIFVGTRLEFQLRNVAVIGFFRQACIWIDVTQGGISEDYPWPRFVDYRTGTPFLDNISQTGGDGTYFENVTTHGGLWGVRVQGGEPKDPAHVSSDRPNILVKTNAVGDPTGASVTGIERTDTRGAYGFSDFVMLGCEIFGGVHSTRRRYMDFPSGATVAQRKTNLATKVAYLELGGAFLMSGISGNGSDVLRGHRYIGTRFASGGPFTILINYSGRDTFIGCHGEDIAFYEGYGQGSKHLVEPTYENSFGILCLTSNHIAYKNISSVVPLLPEYYDYKYPDTTVGAEYTGSYPYSVNLAGEEMRVSLRNGLKQDRAFHVNYNTYNGLTIWPEPVTDTEEYLDLRFSQYLFKNESNTELMNIASSGNIRVKGNLIAATNTTSLGTGNDRWGDIYTVNSHIGSSDERLKENIAEPDEALMRAWGKVRFVVYQFKDAVERKGDAARLHLGVIAQEVERAFAEEGLDASRYGLFCHDTWEDEYEEHEVMDEPAVVGDDGVVLTPAKTHIERKLVRPAGDEYAMRYTEALVLESAYQRWRLDRLEKALGVSNA